MQDQSRQQPPRRGQQATSPGGPSTPDAHAFDLPITTGYLSAGPEMRPASAPAPAPVTTGVAGSRAPPEEDAGDHPPLAHTLSDSSAGSRGVAPAPTVDVTMAQQQQGTESSSPEPKAAGFAVGAAPPDGGQTGAKKRRQHPPALLEQRRQRRLAKNREAAANSRERKRVELAGLQDRVAALESANAGLAAGLAQRDAELGLANEQLASLRTGVDGRLPSSVSAPAAAAAAALADSSQPGQRLANQPSRPPPTSEGPAGGAHGPAGGALPAKRSKGGRLARLLSAAEEPSPEPEVAACVQDSNAAHGAPSPAAAGLRDQALDLRNLSWAQSGTYPRELLPGLGLSLPPPCYTHQEPLQGGAPGSLGSSQALDPRNLSWPHSAADTLGTAGTGGISGSETVPLLALASQPPAHFPQTVQQGVAQLRGLWPAPQPPAFQDFAVDAADPMDVSEGSQAVPGYHHHQQPQQQAAPQPEAQLLDWEGRGGDNEPVPADPLDWLA